MNVAMAEYASHSAAILDRQVLQCCRDRLQKDVVAAAVAAVQAGRKPSTRFATRLSFQNDVVPIHYVHCCCNAYILCGLRDMCALAIAYGAPAATRLR